MNCFCLSLKLGFLREKKAHHLYNKETSPEFFSRLYFLSVKNKLLQTLKLPLCAHLYIGRQTGGWDRGKGAWSLLFAGREFADLAGCGHALAGGVWRRAGAPIWFGLQCCRFRPIHTNRLHCSKALLCTTLFLRLLFFLFHLTCRPTCGCRKLVCKFFLSIFRNRH